MQISFPNRYVIVWKSLNCSGYTLEEKISIAHQHLVKKAIANAGLDGHNIVLTDAIIKEIIADHTRESGVRQLERLISKLCSKATRMFVEMNKIPEFSPKNLEIFLGPCRFIDDGANKNHQIGISNGLSVDISWW